MCRPVSASPSSEGEPSPAPASTRTGIVGRTCSREIFLADGVLGSVAPRGRIRSPCALASSDAWICFQVDEVVEAAERSYEEVAATSSWSGPRGAAPAASQPSAGRPVERCGAGHPHRRRRQAPRRRARARSGCFFSTVRAPQENLPSPVRRGRFEGGQGHEDFRRDRPRQPTRLRGRPRCPRPAFFEEVGGPSPIRTVLDEGLAQSLVSRVPRRRAGRGGRDENPTVIKPDRRIAQRSR